MGSPLDHGYGVPDGGVGALQLRAVVPVEVPPGQRAAVVAHDHSIWVQHGHHLEHKHVPQHLQWDTCSVALISYGRGGSALFTAIERDIVSLACEFYSWSEDHTQCKWAC